MASSAPEEDQEFVLLAFTENEPILQDINNLAILKDNFMGGKPLFSPRVSQEEIDRVLGNEQLTCRCCGVIRTFIGQMNCPVGEDDENFDRILYAFACINKSCKRKTWKVVRVVTPAVDVPNSNDSDKKSNTKQGGFDEDNDWGEDDEGNVKDSKASEGSEAEGSNVNGTPPITSPPVTIAADVHKFKGHYLIIEEEDYIVQQEEEKKNDKIKGKASGVAVEEAPPGMEKYEKFMIPGTDEVSNRFIKRISKFPSQVIRYCLDGTPLLNQTVEVTPIDCPSCGSKRRFELQFTPGLISTIELESGVDASSYEVDFGTVLVFTCLNDCKKSIINEEEVIVLDDPDSELVSSSILTKR